jgi:hypothetical protein
LAPLILTPSGAGDADGRRTDLLCRWVGGRAGALASHEFEDGGYQSDLASGFDFDDQGRAVWRRRGERPVEGFGPRGRDEQRVSAKHHCLSEVQRGLLCRKSMVAQLTKYWEDLKRGGRSSGKYMSTNITNKLAGTAALVTSGSRSIGAGIVSQGDTDYKAPAPSASAAFTTSMARSGELERQCDISAFAG